MLYYIDFAPEINREFTKGRETKVYRIMNKPRVNYEYKVSKRKRNGEKPWVFDFLNRVFDRMKMHKVEKTVDITEKSCPEKTFMRNTRQSQPKKLDGNRRG